MAERPEDLNLPTPVVSKLISDCLPTSCKVTEEAKVAITKVTLTSTPQHHGWLDVTIQSDLLLVLAIDYLSYMEIYNL